MTNQKETYHKQMGSIHSKLPSDVEERFEKQFEYKTGLNSYYHREVIQSFIASEIQLALSKQREEIIRNVDAKSFTVLHGIDPIEVVLLSDIIKLIK